MFIGALDASGARMICSIGNEQGNILQTASFPTTTPEQTLERIESFFSVFEIGALGIGSFGPLDLNRRSPKYGSITKTPKEGWSGYPLLAELKRRLGVPAVIDTDVNAAALAEHMRGAGKGLDSLLYVVVGSGVGGGYVSHGRPSHGLVHPELGHILLCPREDDPMPDGICPFHRHCLEGLASGPAMERRWGLSPELMTQDHPAWALEAEYLAQLCANAIVAFSPELIVMGGSVMRQGNLLQPIRERTLELLGGYVAAPQLTHEGIGGYIVPPALGMNSVSVGALYLGAQIAAQRER